MTRAQPLAHSDGRRDGRRCAFLWFDHADVEKYTYTNQDECSVVGDKLRDHCFMCGSSLAEMPLHDTWLCEVVEIAVKLRWP